jgi:hypothetical protein
MSNSGYREILTFATGDGPALNTSIVATSIIPTANKIKVFNGPNPFFVVGRRLRIWGAGRLSNIVTTPGTLTLDVRFGAVIAFNGGAMQLSTTAHTTLPFEFEINLTVRAVGNGTSGNVIGSGKVFGQQFSVSGADPTTGHSMLMMPNTTPAVGTGFDSTADTTLDVFATFSISNLNNALTLHQYEVESLN